MKIQLYTTPLRSVSYWNYPGSIFSTFDQLSSVFSDEIYAASRSMSINEEENSYLLTVELPGFKQNHLDVTIEDNMLVINAKKDTQSYSRSVTVPRGVDVSKIEAKLEDGLLNIMLPKMPEAKPRKIAIK